MDGIPPKQLMETVDQISIPLAREFNLSLKEGAIPFEWKKSKHPTIILKGFENYRPVSSTSVMCKLLKTLIKDHMVDFFVRYTLLNPPQHGFLKTRSFLTNTLCFFESLRG